MSKLHSDLQIICLESEAFYDLIEKVVERLRPEAEEPWKWIREEEAMKLLGIKSKSTMQEYRNDGKVRYSQPSRKVILYDRESIEELIQKSVRDF